ncbi:MAG: cysteine desulfurase [Firmicutes bacterium]|nr:cysteine desulfurase [Bacillota bacterium]
MQPVYLDHAATTPLDGRVLEAMLPYLRERFGNPSSPHAVGREAAAAVDRARDQVAAWVGGRAREVLFTSGGTEADNLALRGVLGALVPAGRDVLVISAVEHEAVRETARSLARTGVTVREAPVDEQGRVDLAALETLVDERTALVSVLRVQNETGVVQDVAAVAAIAHRAGALCHTDAVAAAPAERPDAAAWGVDLLSLSGHKVYGPKGVGALWVREGVPLSPVLTGGGQERGRRPGTHDVAGIVGLGAAAALALAEGAAWAEHMRLLKERLWCRVAAAGDAVRTGEGVATSAHTLHVRFPGAPSDSVLIALDAEGVAASAGSACSAGAVGPSRILRAMGVSDEEARCGLRLTLGKDTTVEDVDRAGEALVRAVEGVRRRRRVREAMA